MQYVFFHDFFIPSIFAQAVLEPFSPFFFLISRRFREETSEQMSILAWYVCQARRQQTGRRWAEAIPMIMMVVSLSSSLYIADDRSSTRHKTRNRLREEEEEEHFPPPHPSQPYTTHFPDNLGGNGVKSGAEQRYPSWLPSPPGAQSSSPRSNAEKTRKERAFIAPTPTQPSVFGTFFLDLLVGQAGGGGNQEDIVFRKMACFHPFPSLGLASDPTKSRLRRCRVRSPLTAGRHAIQTRSEKKECEKRERETPLLFPFFA